MPKIRGIKPEYWTDEDVVELSLPARLLFIGLWNLACDNGHLPDKPRQIKMRLLPADDVDVDALLGELESHARIERDGGWVTVRNFAKHQKPHKRWWTTCEQPGCEMPEGCGQPDTNGGPPVVLPLTTVDHGRSTPDVDVDVDVEGDSEGDVDPTPRKRGTNATQLPSDFEPSASNAKYAEEQGIDIDHQLGQFINFHTAKGSKFKDWHAAFRTWLGNANNWGPGRRKATSPAAMSNEELWA